MGSQWIGRYVRLTFLAFMLSTTAAYGQTAVDDAGAKQAMTQKFFERGAQAMADKRYPEACRLFEKVIELAPNGIGGHEALGQCYRQIGLLGSAWAQFTVAETLALAANDKQRAEMLGTHVKDLEPRVATITIHVPKSFKYIEGLRIFKDDVLEEKVLWDTPRPVDVGTHVIRLEAPGQAPWSKEIKIAADGAKQTVVVPPDIVRLHGPEVVSPAPKPMESLTNGRQRLGWVGIGLGGTSLVAAGILASLAVETQNASMDSGHCPTIDRCDAGGLAMRNQARSLADGTTATFVVGSVLAGAGLIFVLTAPKENKPEPSGKTIGLSLSTTISPLGVGLLGTW